VKWSFSIVKPLKAKDVPQLTMVHRYRICALNGGYRREPSVTIFARQDAILAIAPLSLHGVQMEGPALFKHFRSVVVLALLIDPPFIGDFLAMIVPAPVTVK
jgi:hypothetical protein